MSSFKAKASQSLEQRLRQRAMDWLAQREYARHELAQKLARRFAAQRSRYSTLDSGGMALGEEVSPSVDDCFDNAADAAPTGLNAAGKTGRRRRVSAAPEVPTSAQIEAVLDWLEERDFLNDKRCASLYVRSHIERGHGVLRIRQELVYKRGLAAELVEDKLLESGCDWFELAASVLARRFHKPPATPKEKARQLRFLQARGFSAEQCYHALNLLQQSQC